MIHARAIVLVVLFGFAALVGDAMSQTHAQQRQDNPVTVYTGRGAGPARDEAAVARLLQRAEQKGRIRVIVGLDTAVRDEDGLSPGETKRLARALRTMQAAVVKRVFGSSSADGVVRFSTIPFLSMFVNADQLRRLLDDPAVSSIQEDRPVAPSTGAPERTR